ncbi:MAG: hypothetical protein HY563_00130 [Ignavibacteriales bacterium]|nr:hypothetical protein [Ignavibacteriales bacterium]
MTSHRADIRALVRGIVLFSVAFAFVESSVVLYLRELYYPHGFSFPLSPIEPRHLIVEVCRELATILMLIGAGWIAGTTPWQKTAWFMVSFGLWDIFYYVWLKIILDWPSSMFDWDVLFLVPVPWIGPVLAPVLISIILVTAGWLILRIELSGRRFSAPQIAWWLAGLGTVVILYSFTSDFRATLEFQMPQPYNYWLFASGVAVYAAAMIASFRRKEENAG